MIRLSELKEKFNFVWGSETEIKLKEMIDEIYEITTWCGHTVSKYGIMCMLNSYIDNNETNIRLLMKHPNYNGNLQVVIPMEFEREIDTNMIYQSVKNFAKEINADKYILKTKDENGKTMADYVELSTKSHTIKYSKLNELPKAKVNTDILEKFTEDGVIKESLKVRTRFTRLCDLFCYEITTTLTSDTARRTNELLDTNKFVEGMKTSRAFGRACDILGINKLPKYEKAYAEYTNLVTDKKRKLNFVISLNPLDFLKMSFGVNWASCHTIDKGNRRKSKGQTYSGGYCGGTLSYMLDKTSIVTYVIPIEEKNGIKSSERPDRWDKIYRNMFHLQGQQMIQGRIYPQGKDGATDLYKTLRFAMQKAICEMIGIEYVDTNCGSDTWIMKGKTRYNSGSYYESYGAHYRDYDNFSDCNLSYIRGCENNLPIVIGHNGIDLASGETFSRSGEISSGSFTYLPTEIKNQPNYPMYIPN